MKNNKKVLLVLSGVDQMCEIVQDAKDTGYYVIVTDYLENSPAKKIADESWMLSIDDVDGIVAACRESHVDGVMNYCIDPGQKPYQKICERLNLPCVGTAEQFETMTNKDKFKETCTQYGVGTIESFQLDKRLLQGDIDKIEFPVVVKPVDGRASKGISVCRSKEELAGAVKFAFANSNLKRIVVEVQMKVPEICAKYVVCDGEPYLTSMADVHTGYCKTGEKAYIGTQTYPSRYYKQFKKNTDGKIRNMIRGLGIQNGALSFTGFVDGEDFRFFDPSFRMGGAQDWRIVNAITEIDISKLLTNFAMTGRMGNQSDICKIDGAFIQKASALLYFLVREGKIGAMEGIEEVTQFDGVIGYHLPHVPGDVVVRVGTVDHVAIRFLLVTDTMEEIAVLIKKIQDIIKISDINGEDMLLPLFDFQKSMEVPEKWGGERYSALIEKIDEGFNFSQISDCKKYFSKKEKRKALVLAGGLPQIKLIQELQSRGYFVILADYLDKPIAKEYADKFYKKSTLDVVAIQEIASNEQVDMIITCCTDQALATVATVSSKLTLPCYVNDKIGLTVTNKQYMKDIFKKKGIPTAEYKIVNTFELWEEMEYPFVVKPVDCNSSKGVTKVYSDNELKIAIENAIKSSRTKTAVLEEYIEGQEISVDLFVEDGIVKLLCTSFSEKIKDKSSFIIYKGYHPAQLTSVISEKIIVTAQKIVNAFSLENCPMLMQVLVCGEDIYIVEFSARTGGCLKYHMIELASGVDIIKATVDLFEGKKPVIEPIMSDKLVINEFIYCNEGVFSHMEGLEYCKNQAFLEGSFILKSTGDVIETVKSSGDRVAALTYVADSYEDYVEKHNKVVSSLKVITTDGYDMMRHDLLPII